MFINIFDQILSRCFLIISLLSMQWFIHFHKVTVIHIVVFFCSVSITVMTMDLL